MKKGQRQVTIALLRNEVEYDAQSILSVIADTLPSSETAHVKHIYNDICEGENARRTIRFADTAFAVLAEHLHGYTATPIGGDITTDDIAHTPDVYTLAMLMDGDTSSSQVALVKTLAHDYVVLAIVCGWLALIGSDRLDYYASMRDTALADAVGCLDSHNRIGRVTPFFGNT